jgi:hypothetical protein
MAKEVRGIYPFGWRSAKAEIGKVGIPLHMTGLLVVLGEKRAKSPDTASWK